VNGETIVLGTIDKQIPFEDIQYVATYSYNWPTAINDLQNHDSHILVTMISGNGNIVERCKTFSKVLQSILATSNCIGVYQGTQTLLIQKQQYLDKAEILKENTLPVQLWVYVGLRASGNGNSAYTYGLNYFGKQEMETIDSRLDLDALYELFCNISSYVINSDIRFKKGETLGYTTEQKIKITQSKGIYTEGQTLKLKL
jgi:hypothetical protein